MCIFEYIYFARPDSVIAGQSVHQARVNAGKLLAQEHPVEADLVIGVPDSGLDAAQGYARESGIPYGVGFVKNRYVGRTFITPDQASREQAVRIKLAALASEVEGKRVVMVDDSIVRGPPAARSSPCCGRRGPKRSICASPRPLRLPLLLRHRHPQQGPAHRMQPHGGGDPGAHRGGQPGLPLPGAPPPAGPRRPVRLLRRLLHRALPHSGLTGRHTKNARIPHAGVFCAKETPSLVERSITP